MSATTITAATELEDSPLEVAEPDADQQRRYARFLSSHGLSLRRPASGAMKLISQLAELERQEERLIERSRKAASDLDRRRAEARLERIESQRAALYERLDEEFAPEHVEQMQARFEAARSGMLS